MSKEEFVKEMVAANPIMVFSKSYCPYCTKAKRALSAVGAKYKVLELDQEANGPAIQEALQSITGQRTVPNVFVGGKTIGGGDDTARLHQSGELATLAREVGAL